MTETAAGGWRAVIGSSAIMSLALLGDALIYAVLPVYADEFGVSLGWVGLLLSANRFVRVFAYGVIARMTYAIGVRRMCLGTAATAAISTAIYGFGQGPEVLLFGRVLWGLTYAALLLVTLAYAIEFRDQAGTRVGVSRAIQRSGPVLALLGGTWLVGLVGPNNAFIVLAGLTALSVPLALTLPRYHGPETQRDRPSALGRPQPIDILFFMQGFGVDGVFAVSIALIFAREVSPAAAVMTGGALLALRHLGEAVAAPAFGWIADRFGARHVFIASSVLTVVGFVSIAAGLTVFGAIVMLVFRGALASLGPAIIVQALAADAPALAPLARMQAWRDLGAACGPLATGFALAAVSAEMLHAAVAIFLCASLLWWMRTR